MFTRKSKSQLLLESEIESVTRHLSATAVDNQEYPKTLNYLTRLYDLKGEKPRSVDKNTMVIVGGNLLGILMILKHELAHPITSKALSFVIRPR